MRRALSAAYGRRGRLVAVALILGAGASAAAAWVASPPATALDARAARASGGRPLALHEIAPILRDAVVATEDERFYHHHGIDLLGVARAIPFDLVHLSFAQGASTITEQVAKVLYLHGNDHSLWRKLEDATVALRLEHRYSKEQILAAYLNGVYFGEGARGIRAASERYFGVSPSRLDIAQATLLVGLIQGPSAYDPVTQPAAARARQADVLRSLVRDGYLKAHEATVAVSRPLRLRGAAALVPLRGIDFAPGPAFVWWELIAGALLATAGMLVLLVVSQVTRFRPLHGLVAVRLSSWLLVLAGAVAVARSFRAA
jgi:membrane peptidoglycan carboxypeptidase